MHCQHCGSINGEDDHRCLRCGRRLSGVVISAPASYIGATALALSAEPAQERDWTPEPGAAKSPQQPALFEPAAQAMPPGKPRAGSQNVIPFEQVQRQAAGRFPAQQQPIVIANPPVETPGRKPQQPSRPAARKATPPVGQGNLDFRPNSAQGERVLATGVPAQVCGDNRVAPPMRRLTAGAMDVAMVVIGFGVFAASARIAGVFLGAPHGISFGSGKPLWIGLSASLLLISLLYGLVWALAMRETAGMNWTQLHLVSFDGVALEGRDRTIRFVAAWLSYCSGLGLLWALADEESLAFHDHISRTYPAELTTAGVLVRQRK